MSWDDFTWNDFPVNVPKGIQILIGGYTKSRPGYQGGKWVTATAFYGKFKDQLHYAGCASNKNDDEFWIIQGFMTLANFEEIDWKYWSYIKPEPTIRLINTKEGS